MLNLYHSTQSEVIEMYEAGRQSTETPTPLHFNLTRFYEEPGPTLSRIKGS